MLTLNTYNEIYCSQIWIRVQTLNTKLIKLVEHDFGLFGNGFFFFINQLTVVNTRVEHVQPHTELS